jgi:hypothetical protein
VKHGRIAVGLVIGALALVLAFWGVPLDELGRALGSADVRWLLPVSLVYLLQLWLRGWRQLYLIRCVAPDVSFRSSLSILSISLLVVNMLPARLGEAARPILLLEKEGIPLGTGVAVTFLERAIDLCATLLLLTAVMWWVPAPSRTLVVAGIDLDWTRLGRMVGGVALPGLTVGLVLLLWGAGPLAARLGTVKQSGTGESGRLVRIARRFAGAFALGLEEARVPGVMLPVIVLTLVSWLSCGWIYIGLAEMFEVREWIGYGEGLGVMTLTMLGTVLPSAPGFIGTYEAFCRGALALFGVAGGDLDARALGYALVLHWWIAGLLAVVAAWFLVFDGISLRRLLRIRPERTNHLESASDT